jgi:hypothetical protein
MLPQGSYIIRSRQWPVLFMGLVVGGPFLIAYFIDPSDTVVGWFLLFVLFLCLLFYIVNSKFHLYIDDEVLIYRTALFKKELRWRDIIRSDIGWAIEGMHTASINWHFIATNKTLEIRLGFFSRNDMQLMAQQLIEKAPQAQLSQKVYQFANGQFPWYLF